MPQVACPGGVALAAAVAGAVNADERARWRLGAAVPGFRLAPPGAVGVHPFSAQNAQPQEDDGKCGGLSCGFFRDPVSDISGALLWLIPERLEVSLQRADQDEGAPRFYRRVLIASGPERSSAGLCLRVGWICTKVMDGQTTAAPLAGRSASADTTVNACARGRLAGVPGASASGRRRPARPGRRTRQPSASHVPGPGPDSSGRRLAAGTSGSRTMRYLPGCTDRPHLAATSSPHERAHGWPRCGACLAGRRRRPGGWMGA